MPVVVTPPPMTIPPGPAPATKSRLAGKRAGREGLRLNPARENAARNVLRKFGEKMCVPGMLATCIRSVVYEANEGSAKGTRLFPLGIKHFKERESRSLKL